MKEEFKSRENIIENLVTAKKWLLQRNQYKPL